MIRDQLDVGRPLQIVAMFQRLVSRSTPGTFGTRVLTEEVDPTLCCYYKSPRLKQYFKEDGRYAPRPSSAIRMIFRIERRVCAKNWHALRLVGDSANQRLRDAEAADAQPAPGAATFASDTTVQQR